MTPTRAVLSSRLLAAFVLTAWAGSTLRADALQEREERAIQAALAKVSPSVVRIETVGGLEMVGRVLIGTGPTTGLVVSADGYVVSSAFNFAQKPDSILVTLSDGARRPARLVATDHSRMLVLLKVETDSPLAVPEVAPRKSLRVGQWALAVGRTFELEQPNLSVGIISALDRIWGRAIQTDAKTSPNNYGGPLVDISGRVMGVIVPMTPDGSGDAAGMEWYDSGIGFAVPLDALMAVVPRMIAGDDLQPGLLGVSFKGSDVFSLPAEIAVSRAKGPAYAAGLRAGDTIVEAAGRPIMRQAQLKQLLGPLYAGEKLAVVYSRGSEKFTKEVELVGHIDPYEFGFLGILPQRPLGDATGLVVRYVFSKSPAANAGIRSGDRLLTVGEQKINSRADLAAALQALGPDVPVKLQVGRGGETLHVAPTLARLPRTIAEVLPAEFPPAYEVPMAPPATVPAVGPIGLSFPEYANECPAYVPTNYDPRAKYGVVVWLQSPGRDKPEEIIDAWKPLCEKYDLILLAPKPLDATKWQGSETHFIRRAMDDIAKNYSVDPARVVVHGHEAGGAMAFLFGFAHTDLVRAIAVSESFLPRVVQAPETEPVRPQAIYVTKASKSDMSSAIDATIKRLGELKYPVSVKEFEGGGRYLAGEELVEFARWIDALDRL